jgi:integrase
MPPSWPVFVSPTGNGKKIGRNTLGERFREVLNGLGYGRDYQLYSWKHTGAIACVKAGISLKELQLQLRHHSLDMVDRYLRQLGVADLAQLKANFPLPGAAKAA